MSTLVEDWIKNLRSGEYEQGTGHLVSRFNKDPRWCCLGVLWDTAIERGDTKDSPVPTLCSIDIPDEIMSLCGLNQKGCEDLAELNDDGMSFDGIAKIIEDRYKK